MKKEQNRTDPAPKKRLGQNFLINPSVAPRMIEQSPWDPALCALEIGPGKGALTEELAERFCRVAAIEIDTDLIPALRETVEPCGNVSVIEGDALQLPLAEIAAREFGGAPFAVFGNLPYYITSPLIMRMVTNRLPAAFFTFLIQKEAAQRICAPERSRASGAVTLAIRYYTDPEILFDVAPGSFRPIPKVTSSVICLQPKQPPVRPNSEEAMFRLIRAAFGERRKTAANAISSKLNLQKEAVVQAIESLGFDPDARAETMGLAEYAAISDRLFSE